MSYGIAQPGLGMNATLAPATANALGGVRVGANISVAADGTISVPAPVAAPVSSVFGRTGAVVAATGDYTAAMVIGAMSWVPYTGSGQAFLNQNLTRDGDWTMVANKNTSTRPAPQPSGAEEDLLPAWTPNLLNVRASYTLYNEWTLNTGGWIERFGTDILSQNVPASHTITLAINGIVKDAFTAVPNTSGTYWHDITPIIVASGAVIRVTVQVTEVANNQMYWQESAGLFSTAPTYCSLAVGSKDGAAPGTTAYGCHLMFVPGTASPDW